MLLINLNFFIYYIFMNCIPMKYVNWFIILLQWIFVFLQICVIEKY